MKKTDKWAIAQMRDWLSYSFPEKTPRVIEVVYRKNISIKDREEKIFLVRYKLNDGFESIGFVGPETWSFTDIGLTEMSYLKKRTRMRRLVNLYLGWLFVYRAEKNADYSSKVAQLMDRNELSIALERELKGELNLNRSTVTENAEAMGNTYAVGVPMKYCQLLFDGEPQATWLKGKAHYAVPVTAQMDLAAFHSRYTGQVKSQFILLIKARKKSSNKIIMPRSIVQLNRDLPVFSKLPLFHFIGTLYGPFELKKFGYTTYYDY